MIIAHRGESYIAPENTLSSINLAWKNGCRAVEIDIRLTSDRKIAVIHDKDTGRTGDVSLAVSDSTLEQLKTVDVGKKKGIEFSGEKIPSLKEVLKTIPANGKLVIEIKSGREIIPPLLQDLQDEMPDHSRVEIISYNMEVLSGLKKEIPGYKMLWILDLDYYLPHWFFPSGPAKLVRKVLKNNLDGVDVWAGKTLNSKFVGAFKEQGLWLYTWTVNDPEKARVLFSLGVDAVTSDRAAWLNEELIKTEQ